MPGRDRPHQVAGKTERRIVVTLTAQQAADVERIRRALRGLRGRQQSFEDVVQLSIAVLLAEVTDPARLSSKRPPVKQTAIRQANGLR